MLRPTFGQPLRPLQPGGVSETVLWRNVSIGGQIGLGPAPWAGPNGPDPLGLGRRGRSHWPRKRAEPIGDGSTSTFYGFSLLCFYWAEPILLGSLGARQTGFWPFRTLNRHNCFGKPSAILRPKCVEIFQTEGGQGRESSINTPRGSKSPPLPTIINGFA